MTAPSLLDSNILIYYLNDDNAPGFVNTVEAAVLAGSVISIITRIEVLGWHGHSDTSRTLAEEFLSRLPELSITHAIASRTIALRSTSSIRLGDALLAATALETNLPLMTRNVSDFSNIQNLRLINPFATIA